MAEFMRRARRFPVVLMALRLLDYKARYDREDTKGGCRRVPYRHVHKATIGCDFLENVLHETARAIGCDPGQFLDEQSSGAG